MGARYERETTINWGQCDPAGIVYYPNYFDMFNTSAEALVCRALDVHPRDLTRVYNFLGIPMREARNLYHRPSRNGDVIRIVSEIASIGRSSLHIEHKLYKADGELAVEGFEVRVWTQETATGQLQSLEIPADARAKLTAG